MLSILSAAEVKRSLIVAGLALLSAASFSGCNRPSADVVSADDVALAPQFSAKHGLILPEQTRRSLGVKVVDVAERKVTSMLTFELRVYRSEEGRAFASTAVVPQQAKLLTIGQSLEIRSPHDSDLTAKVTGMNEALLKMTGSVEVLVEIPVQDYSLPTSSFLEATVIIPTEAVVTTVPRSAVLGCSEGYFVYTVSGEHLVRTAVQLGASDSEFVEVTDGLYSGDQVVAQPVVSLWMTELAAVKGGQACCIEPPKGK